MAKIENFKVGADVEVFLKEKNGKYISAVGLIGGTKTNPRLVTNYGHALQEDNVAAEFNIPPTQNDKDFAKELKVSIRELTKIIPKTLNICLESSAIFDKDQLETPESQEFGCDPDFNAYTLSQNKKPDIMKNPYLRSIGGHIHVGYDHPNVETNRDIIIMLDLLLGVPSILIDMNIKRRELYGKAGCFRNKIYGVEYRTLSSFWIKTDELMQWVFNGVKKSVSMLNKEHKIPEKDWKVIQDCINNNDINMAKMLIDVYNIAIPKSIKEVYTLI
jgi:hypothetical protein